LNKLLPIFDGPSQANLPRFSEIENDWKRCKWNLYEKVFAFFLDLINRANTEEMNQSFLNALSIIINQIDEDTYMPSRPFKQVFNFFYIYFFLISQLLLIE